MSLTKRQEEILGYINEFIDEFHFPPSVRDIAKAFNLASAGGVHKHLKNLQDKGYITHEKDIARSIHITERYHQQYGSPVNTTKTASNIVELPLKGKVAAGFPIQYNLDNETMSFPESMVRKPEKTYVLQVQGDSMIEECICDGDYVLVEQKDHADNGEMVIAMINYSEATLKKFFLEGKNVRLQPANHKMAPIIADPKEVSIQGIVVGVMRQYR